MSNNYAGTNLKVVYSLNSIPTYVTNFENKLYWLTPNSKEVEIFWYFMKIMYKG